MFIIGKIISDGETNFTQHKYKMLQNISAKCKSANMGSSTVQFKWCRPDRYQIDRSRPEKQISSIGRQDK